VTNKVTKTKLAMQGSYFYATQARRQLASYQSWTCHKSNYTSTMYMKVIQACVLQNANHQEVDEDNTNTVVFLPRFTWLPPSYVPIVSTAHLVVRQLIGITRQARTLGTTRTYLKSEGSLMTRSTRVALCDPCGVSTISLINPPLEHRTIFSCTSTKL
jgi:hypothetical protein